MVPHLRQQFSRCSSLLVPWALLIFSSKCFTVIEVKTWLIGTGLVITIYTTLFICTTITSTTHRQMRSHKEPCLIHLCYMLWGKTTLSFLFCKMQCFKTIENVIISFQFLHGSDRLIFERTWDFLSLVFQTLFQRCGWTSTWYQNEIWNAKIGFCTKWRSSFWQILLKRKRFSRLRNRCTKCHHPL